MLTNNTAEARVTEDEPIVDEELASHDTGEDSVDKLVEKLVPIAIPGAPKGLAVGSHPLPFWRKVALYVVGTLFILLGIAGIFLPILQGVLFLLIGAAVLSVASERVYDWMYRLLHRRPKIWGRVHRFRARVHDKLSPKVRPSDDA